MKSLGLPLIYRQGPGILDSLGDDVKMFGRRALVIYDARVRDLLENRVHSALESEGVQARSLTFSGQTSPAELERIVEISKNEECDFVIGLGGGKAQDAAKVVKKETGRPVVIVPTIASNDAATSRLAITYTDEGRFIGPIVMQSNPDAVVVDSEIIVQAPLRFFVAGVGDALSTWFEAEQCYRSGAHNFFGARPTEAALILAKHCHDVVWNHAEEAVSSIKNGAITDAVEKVIEANVLLSGIGFEGCGVAAAHAISQGFTLIDELHGNLHGEEVAVALLSQFVLEGRDEDFLGSMVAFYRKIGLPVSLNELGLSEATDERFSTIAAFACRDKSRIYNMAQSITEQSVFSAIKRAEMFATEYTSTGD